MLQPGDCRQDGLTAHAVDSQPVTRLVLAAPAPQISHPPSECHPAPTLRGDTPAGVDAVEVAFVIEPDRLIGIDVLGHGGGVEAREVGDAGAPRAVGERGGRAVGQQDLDLGGVADAESGASLHPRRVACLERAQDRAEGRLAAAVSAKIRVSRLSSSHGRHASGSHRRFRK